MLGRGCRGLKHVSGRGLVWSHAEPRRTQSALNTKLFPVAKRPPEASAFLRASAFRRRHEQKRRSYRRRAAVVAEAFRFCLRRTTRRRGDTRSASGGCFATGKDSQCHAVWDLLQTAKLLPSTTPWFSVLRVRPRQESEDAEATIIAALL